MSYYFTKQLNEPFDSAVARVTEALSAQGFGILTRIDVQETLKKKIGADIPRYLILGACNPTFAHKALQVEDKIGTMLPCNVIVQERGKAVDVSAVDPVASMQAVENAALTDIALAVREKLRAVIAAL